MCIHMYMYEFLCHGVHVKVTGQLCRVGSCPPSSCGLQGLDLDGLAYRGSTFYLLIHIAASTKNILTVISNTLWFYTEPLVDIKESSH